MTASVTICLNTLLLEKFKEEIVNVFVKLNQLILKLVELYN